MGATNESEKTVEDARRILFVPSGAGACTWYRCLTPAKALHARGHLVRVDPRITAAAVDWCDVLVAQRACASVMLDVFEYLKGRGATAIYDIDDDLWNISPSNPAHAFWHRPEAQLILTKLVRMADLVTTTTPALAAKLSWFNRNVAILPNMLPEEYWPEAGKELRHADPLVVGWAGSRTHAEDFRVLDGVLNRVLDRFPNVEVHLAGASQEWLEPHERILHLSEVEIADYAGLIGGFDVAVAPLKVSKFNQCKSDLKVLEYSMVGLPTVATKVDSYSSFIRHGENGMLASSAKDWLSCVARLIEDSDLRRSLGASARKAAERRTMSKNVSLYEKAYRLLG